MPRNPPAPTTKAYREAGSRTWVTCQECERDGHPLAADIGRDGSWTCRDCRDPFWRTALPEDDPRHRKPGKPRDPIFEQEAFEKARKARAYPPPSRRDRECPGS